MLQKWCNPIRVCSSLAILNTFDPRCVPQIKQGAITFLTPDPGCRAYMDIRQGVQLFVTPPFHQFIPFLARLHFSAEELLLYPGVSVRVHMQNVRANVKKSWNLSLCVFFLAF